MSDNTASAPPGNLSRATWQSNETGSPPNPNSDTGSTSGLYQASRSSVALKPVIDIGRLYDAPPGTASHMVAALKLLKESYENLSAAQNASSTVEADRFVQHVQSALPKLFACRSIGDGFASIIVAIDAAFTNQRGEPLAGPQLNVLWRVVRELRNHPAMSLDQGIVLVEELESQGLAVDPPFVGKLLEEVESGQDG